VKAHIGRWSEDCPEHQGVIVLKMDDTPLVGSSLAQSGCLGSSADGQEQGFGVTARSTAETRRLDPVLPPRLTRPRNKS